MLIMMQLSEKKRCRRAWFYTQKRYKLHPRWIHVMGHIMHQRPSWNYCTYRLISLAFTSRSTVLYASYLCLFLIYCLTHVECFHFFLVANIITTLQTTSAVLQARTIASVSSILQKDGFLGHVTHVTGEITRFKASLQLAFDLLATRSRMSANLCQPKNFNHKSPGIPIRIAELI